MRFALRHRTCLFQGEMNKKEKQAKRDWAINITQAAKCRAKETLKGMGT